MPVNSHENIKIQRCRRIITLQKKTWMREEVLLIANFYLVPAIKSGQLGRHIIVFNCFVQRAEEDDQKVLKFRNALRYKTAEFEAKTTWKQRLTFFYLIPNGISGLC